jgi:hypothetical protein
VTGVQTLALPFWPAIDGRPTIVACFTVAPRPRPGAAMRADGRLVRLLADDRFRRALLTAARDARNDAELRRMILAAHGA